MPEYPPLRPYYESVKDLLAKQNTLEFNPKKARSCSPRRLEERRDGVLGRRPGEPPQARHHRVWEQRTAIGPVITELLRRQGVEASMSLPPDFDDRFNKGQYAGAIYGTAECARSVLTLRLYQSASVAVRAASGQLCPVEERGLRQDRGRGLRHRHEEQGQTDRTMAQGHGNLDPRTPGSSVGAQLHRLPMNTTYWTNYPRAEPYINGAMQHLTFAMVLWKYSHPVSF